MRDNDFIFENGQWVSCEDLIPFEATWEQGARAVGLRGYASHTFGHPDGWVVEVHNLRAGEVFAPNPAVTHLVVLVMGDDVHHFYCTGMEVFLNKLDQLTRISTAEILTIEQREARERRTAFEVEEVIR